MTAAEKLTQVPNSRRSLLSVEEVAELLQVPVSWVYERKRWEGTIAFPVSISENTGVSTRPKFVPGSSVSAPEGVMPDFRAIILADTGKSGRAATERGSMARPRYQNGSLVVRGKPKRYVLRWTEDIVKPDGAIDRIQHAETIGFVSQIKRQQALEILQARVSAASQQKRRPQGTVTLAEFVRAEWKPNAALKLKNSSMRHYSFKPRQPHSPGVRAVAGARPRCRAYRGMFVETEAEGACDIDAAQRACDVCHGLTTGRGTRVPREKPRSWSPYSRNGLEKAAVLLGGTNTPAARCAGRTVRLSSDDSNSDRHEDRRDPRAALETRRPTAGHP
jgi:hypothetical protein